MDKKIIVVSAVNLVDGGPLTVLRDCFNAFSELSLDQSLEIHFLVANENVLSGIDVKNVILHYFPDSKKSWFRRVYFEYIFFKSFSKKIGRVYSWFSLHDTSPRVLSSKQYVYCHNPSVFLKLNFSDLFKDPKQFLFSKLYKYLYRFNIKSNDAVIVQQHWFASYFSDNFNSEVIVSRPNVGAELVVEKDISIEFSKDKVNLFYPAFPRFFKNHSVIVDAFKRYFESSNIDMFLTITGEENKVAKGIYKKAIGQKNIKFIGLQSHKKTLQMISECDALVFPSKMETWGLPITEAIKLNKPIIVADLPYAQETVGSYDKVFWFNPDEPYSLSRAINKLVSGQSPDTIRNFDSKFKEVNGWDELAKVIVE